MDSVVGTNQRMKDLWRRVLISYKEAQLSSPKKISFRNQESLRARWKRICKAVTQWVGVFEEAQTRKRSGQNEEDVIREAHTLYYRTHNSKFIFFHHWKMLEKFSRWMSFVQATPTLDEPEQPSPQTQSNGKRVRLDDDDDSLYMETPNTGGTNEVNFPLKRPMGVKKAKNKGKKKATGQSSEDIEFTKRVVKLGEITAMKKENEDTANKHKEFQILLNRGYQNLDPYEQKIFRKLAKSLGVVSDDDD